MNQELSYQIYGLSHVVNIFKLRSNIGTGGDNETCREYTQMRPDVLEQQRALDMGELEYVIKNTTRLNIPIRLNPKTATLLDIGIWAYFEKRLSISTIEKRLRYLRFMMNHVVPIDIQNPTYENFRNHMVYREVVENAGPNALIHEWKAYKMVLEAFGIPAFPYKPPYAPKHRRMELPYPNTVRQFFSYRYGKKDSYENALYQYLFYHSFLVGWRTPSEIIELTVDDIHFESGDRGYLTITETKKHKRKRTIIPENHILSSRSHKSFRNWLDIWRPKVENQHSGNALYLQPDGKPFTVRHLGHKLSVHGKKIWPHFRPYDLRHWCAVARLIETKITGGKYDIWFVKNWLGHEDLKTTEGYIHFADLYYRQYPYSWLKHALRPSYRGGKHEPLQSKGWGRNQRFSASLPEISPYGLSGPAEI